MLLEIFDPKAPPTADRHRSRHDELARRVRRATGGPWRSRLRRRTAPAVGRALRPKGGVIVGTRRAGARHVANRSARIASVKRFMGRGADDPETRRLGPTASRRRGPTRSDASCASTSASASSRRSRCRAEILTRLQAERARPAAQRRRRGDHRAGVLRRRAAPGDARTPGGSPGSRCCGCSTSRPRPRSPTASTSSRTACSRSTTSAAARSTSRSSCSTTACSR